MTYDVHIEEMKATQNTSPTIRESPQTIRLCEEGSPTGHYKVRISIVKVGITEPAICLVGR